LGASGKKRGCAKVLFDSSFSLSSVRFFFLKSMSYVANYQLLGANYQFLGANYQLLGANYQLLGTNYQLHDLFLIVNMIFRIAFQ
jgi:hypothetical protein